MRRLNALAAVRSLLPDTGRPNIYIADFDANQIFAMAVDPLTGNADSTKTKQIDLNLTQLDLNTGAIDSISGEHPTSLAVSPTSDHLYGVIHTSNYGDGVLIINTQSLKTEGFIPFSGVEFPSVGGGGTGLDATILRPGLAFSKDGRLLFAAIGDHLVIVNTVNRKVVKLFEDLPAPYPAVAFNTIFSSTLAQRLSQLETLIRNGAGGSRPGTGITALRVSPDGNTLYAVMTTGVGLFSQPGAVIPININLYTDDDPALFDLQSNLDNFLLPAFSSTPSLRLPTPSTAAAELLIKIQGDEPSDVAVSPDGRYVYMLNGGVRKFSSLNTNEEDVRLAILQWYAATLFSFSLSTSLIGAITGAVISNILADAAAVALYRAMIQQGLTLVEAPGITAVFDTQGTPLGDKGWLYPADVGWSWVGKDALPSGVYNEALHEHVYSSRPFGIAMKPDGKRAVVSFFQTGNFGVLDQTAQDKFRNFNADLFGGVPTDQFFLGLAGVTPALNFTRQLWPADAHDERRLFPTQVEYAQNGRFAVGIHTGAGDAGALTVIDDNAITTDLANNAGTSIGGQTQQIGYYARNPICKTKSDEIPNQCDDNVFTTIFDHSDGSGSPTAFKRPRGLAIEPFVRIEGPRFGDQIYLATGVQVRWRDTDSPTTTGATNIVAKVSELVPGAPPAQVGTAFTDSISPDEQKVRTLKREVLKLLNNNQSLLTAGHRYRIEITIKAGAHEIGTTYIDGEFKQ